MGIEVYHRERNKAVLWNREGSSKKGIKERLGSMAEIGTLNDVHIAMVINEQAAGFCLPDLSGKVNFRTGFAGTDVQFMQWCTELYQYYWERSRKIALFE